MKPCFALTLAACAFVLSSSQLLAEQAHQQNNPDYSELQLELKRISLDAETGKMDDAFRKLDTLKAKHPNNPHVLQAEADLNLRTGNRGAGFAALNRALILDPGNEDIMDRQRSAMLTQGSYVAGGYKVRRSKQATEQFENFAEQIALSSSTSAEINLENNHLRTRRPFTRADGNTESFSGDRQRATATLGKLYDNGDEASASLFAGNNSVGAGALYRLWDRHGATVLQANINRPNWDYIESVIDNGTKHNVRLERKQIFSSALQATLGGGYNHYNLQDDHNVAGAAAWDMNVGYTHPYAITSDNNVILGAYYSIDAEYFTQADHRTAGGVSYMPLPAKSYEIHSFNLSASKELSPQWYIEGFGGYSVDRLGGDGPSFGGAIEYAPMEHLGLELRASRGIMGERASEKVDQVALNLKWRW
jgi:hypothetical protein